jgi:hypothetical protein
VNGLLHIHSQLKLIGMHEVGMHEAGAASTISRDHLD